MAAQQMDDSLPGRRPHQQVGSFADTDPADRQELLAALQKAYDTMSDTVEKKVELIEKTRAYDGFFKIDRYRLRHTTPDGTMGPEITRENFERGNAAAILVYDKHRDAVLLVEEFRIGNYAAGMTGEDAWSLAPMAGMIEEGETGIDCVIREAREEAGIVIDEADVLGPWRALSSPGGTSEIVDVFVAFAPLDLDPSLMGNDEGEFTRPVTMPREAMLELIDTKPVPASLAMAGMRLQRLLDLDKVPAAAPQIEI